MKIASIAGLIALVTSSLAIAQNAAQISSRAYVEEALNYMQESALNKHSINWQAVREQIRRNRHPHLRSEPTNPKASPL